MFENVAFDTLLLRLASHYYVICPFQELRSLPKTSMKRDGFGNVIGLNSKNLSVDLNTVKPFCHRVLKI